MKTNSWTTAGQAKDKFYEEAVIESEARTAVKSSSSIPTHKLNDFYAEDDFQKANLLNTYFISQSNVINDNKSLPELEPTQHSLNVIQINCQDVRDVLRNLNVSKSCSPDLIIPRLLKEGADILDKPINCL